MNPTKFKEGSCLCGKVQISIQPETDTFDACHCGMCRKWGGGPALTVEGGEHISIKGEDSISRYNSSEWAERGFCKNCGTHLFYRLKALDFYNFSLGIFSGTEQFKFQTQIFIDSKPDYYDFANVTQKMTEAEVLAKFNATTDHKD